MANLTSRTAEIREVARTDSARAEAMLSALLADLFGIEVRDLRINHDQYSLNSLNGFFSDGTQECFFKFHQEEGEEEMTGEYYRADILARAGLPVDQPILMSTLPGEQVLVYRRRRDPRFSDVLRDLDQTSEPAGIERAADAEGRLNDRLLQVARDSLHPITPDQAAAEPIHRLFHERLIDQATASYPGGRLQRFYVGQTFDLPGMSAGWDELSAARPVLNGIAYDASFGELFDRAWRRLAPRRLADAGGVVAHGDAHNANVWYERGEEADNLAFFDPAFAGSDVPALLAEVKSTFHNVFAHPFWLYDGQEIPGRYHVSAALEDGCLRIDTDWDLSPVRRRLLQVKAERYWRPWLRELSGRGMLPDDWEDVVRLALFLCPTLVMNLRAGAAGPHTPASSALGLMMAIRVGARPVAGETDIVSEFFDSIRPQV